MQEIEIELKNELNDEEYTYLKNTLFKEAQMKEQTNHYFETSDFQLKMPARHFVFDSKRKLCFHIKRTSVRRVTGNT